MNRIISIVCLIFMFSCTQRDPNPERADFVYRDLSKELDLVKKSIDSAQVEYDARLADLRLVVPQTGQIKSFEKKVFESKNQLERLKQQQQFFEISLEQRKKHVSNRYDESYRGGRTWPDAKEIEIYEQSQKLQREKIAWEKSKGMVKNVPRGTVPVAKPPEESASE